MERQKGMGHGEDQKGGTKWKEIGEEKRTKGLEIEPWRRLYLWRQNKQKKKRSKKKKWDDWSNVGDSDVAPPDVNDNFRSKNKAMLF